MMQPDQMGIYLNAKEATVVRITSPYWIPEEPDWALVTNNPNETLLRLREIIKDRALVPDPSSVHWGNIPLRD
ncbi:MAG: hypothetical protein O7F09_01475 [Chloroflexi bacterium]|nr:hypothetical protein [Chloroflexota bacterium]MCZ6789381.1 hypothetical protein [Chloroflexota bacterium]MCZ6891166.1 hypothetical protein [Chloroflexota bacterium]